MHNTTPQEVFSQAGAFLCATFCWDRCLFIRNTVICSITTFFSLYILFFQRGRVKETDKTIQTGEKGRIHVSEHKEEEEEEEEAEAEEESGGKATAGRPLLPASQPALSPKRWRLLDEAERKPETMPRPAVSATDTDWCWRKGLMLLCCIVEDAERTGGLLKHKRFPEAFWIAHHIWKRHAVLMLDSKAKLKTMVGLDLCDELTLYHS